MADGVVEGGAPGKAATRGALTAQRQAMGGATRAQKRQPRKDGWTKTQEAQFLAVLAETCNASEAAREVGKCRAGAYRRKQDDPGFARAWDEALAVGYAEIEAMLMREVLFGSEVEEVTMDGEGAVKARKVKRARDLTIALRLLTLHKDKVARIMAQAGAGPGETGPDSVDAQARVQLTMVEIKRSRARQARKRGGVRA